MSLYDFSLKSLDGQPMPLSSYRGKVVLAVNVASECGYTPQYAGLQRLQDAFGARGFAVIGFPCNQFGGQEPGGPETVQEVKGPGQAPVFAFLAGPAGEPKWNFTKYLVGKDGQVVQAFPSAVEPESPELRKAIEAALAG